jgi:DNA-binding GntR family transcriptional regulator
MSSAREGIRVRHEPRDGTRRPPLDVEIGERIIREIIALEHPPGTWLREQELAQRFQVSRSPVREALRHVARAGFVEMRPWRGAQVLELSAAETRNVFDLLEAVYGVVARIAATTVPEDRFPYLRDLLAQGRAAIDAGTREDRVNISFEMGRYLGRWGASRVAYDAMIRAGSLALWQHRFLLPDDLRTAIRSWEVHCTLVSAVEARDAAVAGQAARSIVAITRSALIPRMAEQPRDGLTTGD